MAKKQGDQAALITVESALVEAGESSRGHVLIDDVTAAGCTIRMEFGEPTLSKSGGSYLVAYGRGKFGALTITATAYIGLGRDKARQTATRPGDRDEAAVPADRKAAERFYRR